MIGTEIIIPERCCLYYGNTVRVYQANCFHNPFGCSSASIGQPNGLYLLCRLGVASLPPTHTNKGGFF